MAPREGQAVGLHAIAEQDEGFGGNDEAEVFVLVQDPLGVLDAGKGRGPCLAHEPRERARGRSGQVPHAAATLEGCSPPGRPGPGGDNDARGGLPLDGGPQGQLVAGALVARVPNEYLVEGGERTRVVGGCPDHRQLVHSQVRARVNTAESRNPLVGSASHEHAGVRLRDGVDADHDLVARVFGDVGDQAVGTDDDDDVLGGEEEARQALARHVGARPPLRDACAHAGQGCLV